MKLQEAEQYALKHLNDIGLNLSSEEIRAANEKAVLDHNAVTRKNTKRPVKMAGRFFCLKSCVVLTLLFFAEFDETDKLS
ncbi:hypothetical protein ACVNS2_06475 [Paenibacillus caseinilyticus]|uniref:Uncharacterized protein n=1 Tax=Paenibacillus mucilaginosus K02 TaxID=997761 RepID=I0BD74_9BACL|nr:hypothetical protein [Paenibacillus mucilaginosus]AFH60321.1 hypothetical protein B2K_06210 [Paenibacillus mucilaginosus K02]